MQIRKTAALATLALLSAHSSASADVTSITVHARPGLFGVHPKLQSAGQKLNLLHGIEAIDSQGNDVSQRIQVTHNINYNQDGTYNVHYSVVMDGRTYTADATCTVTLPAWRHQVDQMDQQVNQLADKATKLEKDLPKEVVDQIQPQITAINESIRQLHAKDKDFETDLGELRARITAAEQTIDALKAKDKELDGKLGALRIDLTQLGDRVTALQNQVNNHEQRLDDLEPRMFRAESALAETLQRIAYQEERGKWLTHQLDKLDNKFGKEAEALRQQLAQNQSQLQDLKLSLEALKGRTGRNEQDIQRLFDKLDHANQILDRVERQNLVHEQLVNQLLDRMHTAETQLGHMTDRLKQCETTHEALVEQLKDCEEKYGQLTSQLSEGLQEDQTAIGQLRGTAKDLAGRLAAQGTSQEGLARQLKALQARLEQVEQTLLRHQQQIQALLDRIRRLDAGLKATANQLGDNRKMLQHMQERLEGLDKGSTEDVQQLQRQIDSYKQKQAQLEERQKAILSGLQTPTAEVTNLLALSDKLAGDTQAFNQQLKAQADQVTRLDQRLQQADQGLGDKERRLQAAEQATQALRQKAAQVIQQKDQWLKEKDQLMKQKEQLIHQQSGDLKQRDQKIQQLEDALAKLEAKLQQADNRLPQVPSQQALSQQALSQQASSQQAPSQSTSSQQDASKALPKASPQDASKALPKTGGIIVTPWMSAFGMFIASAFAYLLAHTRKRQE